MSNPFPGWSFDRYDMGIDLCGAGKPYYAPAGLKRIGGAIGGWSPFLYLFQFDPPLKGTYLNCQYIYFAEGLSPPVKPSYRAGEQMGMGTGCIEAGWGSPTSNQRTLAGEHGYSGNNLPPGTGTTQGSTFGATFAKYFGISTAPGAGKGNVQTGSGGGGGAAPDTFDAGKQLFLNYQTLRDMPRDQGSTEKFVPPFQQNLQDLWATSVAGSTTSAAQKAVKGILGAIGGGSSNKKQVPEWLKQERALRKTAIPIVPRRGGIGNRNG